MDLRESFKRDSLGEQVFGDFDRFPLRSDHADVAQRLVGRPAKHAHVVLVAARDDDRVGRIVAGQRREDVLVLGSDHLGRLGKPLAIGVAVPVVNDGGGESPQRGDLGQALRNVSCAEDQRRGHWQDRFHVHVELPAADQTIVVGRFLAKAELQHARLLCLDDISCRLPHFCLGTAASDGAHHGTVLADQHLGALKARDRAGDLDDRRDRALLAGAAKLHQLLVHIHRAGHVPT